MCGVALSKRPDDDSHGQPFLLTQTLAERLHDGPLQDLVALQLKTAVLLRERARPPGAVHPTDQAGHLTEIGELAQAAVEHLQRIIRELCIAEPRRSGLLSRLVTLALAEPKQPTRNVEAALCPPPQRCGADARSNRGMVCRTLVARL